MVPDVPSAAGTSSRTALPRDVSYRHSDAGAARGRDRRPRPRRRLIEGAAGPIADARVTWGRTLRDRDPEEFSAGVAGRRIEAVGRRAKQVVVDLSGGRPHRST